jgi:DNA-binding response OmpR family regulator
MARVLVIEDDDDVRTLLLLVLQRQGYLVRGARDGMRGADLVGEFQPDLIVLNLELPVINGWAVLRRIRVRRSTRRIPTLALTTQMCEYYRLQAHMAGFDEILGKPFDLSIFLNRVAQLLGQRSAPREPGSNTIAC